MHKRFMIPGSVISCAIIILAGGLALAWDKGQPLVAIDQRVEKACHRAVKMRAPLGYRDIRTIAYSQQTERSGVAEGRIMARYSQEEWVDVDWTCNIHPGSNEVIRIEVTKHRTRHGLV